MNRSILSVLTAVMAIAVAAHAGSISGKVSGVAGESVVYVDTIASKTFPAPAEHPVIDQRGLLFQPHITVVLRGTTVEFRNSDNVAHNVFWPSIQQGAKKLPGKNLGTWPQGEKRPFKFDQAGAAEVLDGGAVRLVVAGLEDVGNAEVRGNALDRVGTAIQHAFFFF